MAYDYFNFFFHLYSLLISKVISVCFTSNYTICCNELFPNSAEFRLVSVQKSTQEQNDKNTAKAK